MTGKTTQRKTEIFKEQAGICQEGNVEKNGSSEVCLIFLESIMDRRRKEEKEAKARS